MIKIINWLEGLPKWAAVLVLVVAFIALMILGQSLSMLSLYFKLLMIKWVL